MDWTLLFLLLIALAAIVQLWIALNNQRRQTLSANFAVEEAQQELDRLQAAQAQTIQVTKLAALGQMIAGVAREINAPLGFAQGNIEVVGEMLAEYRSLVQQYDAAVQHCLQPVDLLFSADKASLDKLVKFVEEARRKLFEARANLENSAMVSKAEVLLDDSRGALGRLSGRALSIKEFARTDTDAPVLTDIGERVDNALALAQSRLPERIKLVRQIGALPKVRSVPGDLDQVFLALINNAAAAMEGEGTLTISGKQAGDRIEVVFEDTGSGIGDDILPKIFEPFFTTRPRGEGAGLGLTIAHRIVSGLGGSIQVKTTPKHGSAFSVSLPSGSADGS
ncbi:MAG TPA: ATP-binding protein [Rhodanobacteraceae bacterium]|nr:ATP-binding protein [Rhodanobacteraceae bacterium]